MAWNKRSWRLFFNGSILGIAASCAVTSSAQEAQSAAADEGADSLALRYAAAELVAQVQITGVHRDVDNALSEPGMIAISGYVYSAVSRQVWKGEANRLIAFRLGLEACDKKLTKGESYLIFASPDSYGRLQLRGCDSAVAEPEATQLLARLRDFDKQG
ncbi:hypothetical protein SAMN04487965_0463 [Microbulbifer donghaiensis]|uniref:Uncharacterized protein n=1 Tax=Microbulbifer donghaiensis TaxID=494016 RepID=A0A1M4VM91_9GAMM|nr:hypothetical protein [Microbulbifer donghaiensis]SHE70018.1 hypothetical protein SAMN04487965_0463 [Microbulbifer donghaiensis]